MRGHSTFLAGALFLVLSAGPLRAQDGHKNPHGPLPEGLDCADCHAASGWKPAHVPADFDHRRWSGFALDGRHATASCGACHLDLRFDAPKIAEDDCASCHADFHRGQFAEPCATCHGMTSFAQVPAVRIHARSGFPLTGAHLQISCQSCHFDSRAGSYRNLDRQCVACHRRDFETVKSIDHEARGFSTECLQCHDTRAWADAPKFDHALTGFALVGAHVQLRCSSCHVQPGNALRFTPSGQNDCIACHQADYQRAHGGGGFPTTCLDCHSVDSFHGASFDHASVGFPLVGAHQNAACSGCHIQPGNALKFNPSGPNDCVACHQADFTQAHGGSGFPTTCLDCHDQNSWQGADFDHSSTGFPLVGAHQSLQCSSCHIQPGNALKFNPSGPNDCIVCHQADFTQAHGGSGFPTTCLDCHDQNSFQNADFDHDAQFFPIYSGSHQGRWTACTDCHLSAPADFASFSCTSGGCHGRSDTDSRHGDVRNYVYDSQACYSCHPRGRGGD